MTKAQLRDHILRQIGVIGAYDTADAADAVLMETLITNCQAELEQQEIALWDGANVPAYAVEGMALFVKASAQAWGQEYNPALRDLGLKRLREVTQDRRSDTGKACYF
jgi:hypothetical protein